MEPKQIATIFIEHDASYVHWTMKKSDKLPSRQKKNVQTIKKHHQFNECSKRKISQTKDKTQSKLSSFFGMKIVRLLPFRSVRFGSIQFNSVWNRICVWQISLHRTFSHFSPSSVFSQGCRNGVCLQFLPKKSNLILLHEKLSRQFSFFFCSLINNWDYIFVKMLQYRHWQPT